MFLLGYEERLPDLLRGIPCTRYILYEYYERETLYKALKLDSPHDFLSSSQWFHTLWSCRKEIQ